MSENDVSAELTDDAKEEVAIAVDETVGEEEKEQVTEMTTTTGVRIRVSSLPSQIIASFLSKLTPPEPPTFEVKDGTKTRTEKNYDDPNYLRQLTERAAKATVGMQNLMLLKCPTFLSFPDGFVPYEQDEAWIEEYTSVMGDNPDEFPPTIRYLEWLKWRVFISEADEDTLREIARTKHDVDVEEVEKLASSF